MIIVKCRFTAKDYCKLKNLNFIQMYVLFIVPLTLISDMQRSSNYVILICVFFFIIKVVKWF